MSENKDQSPTYSWVDDHNQREHDLEHAHKDGSVWEHIPGMVYIGSIALLSAILGTEIAKLFVGQGVFLNLIGWGCVIVVGLSAIASYYAKGHVYKNKRQQRLGMFFWALELFCLFIGLCVAIADTFGFAGPALDIARFFGFMSVVVAAFGWGIVQWASPEWKVISTRNDTKAKLDTKLAEMDSQYAMSDEMMSIRRATARNRALQQAQLAARGLSSVPKLAAPSEQQDEQPIPIGTQGDVGPFTPPTQRVPKA